MSADPIIVEYDPAWPQAYDSLAEVLAPALGSLARSVHHVGSTAIPGMPAKPVLDIDIELAPDATVPAASGALAQLGYECQGNRGIQGRYAYRRVSPAVPFSQGRAVWPSHHLYVCPHGSAELARHLLFRNRLRACPALLREYAELKYQALRRADGVRQVYVDEKARLAEPFFRKVLGLP